MKAQLLRIGAETTSGVAGAVGVAATLLLGSVVFSPLIAIIIAGVLIVGPAIAIFAPEAVYILMSAVVPMERLGRFGDDLDLEAFSLMRLVGLGALVTVGLHILLKRQKIEMPAAMVAYGLLCCMAFFSILYAEDPILTQARAITMLGDWLMLFVIVHGVRDWRLINRMLLAWLFATIAVGVWQIWSWHFSPVVEDSDIGHASARFATTLDAMSEVETLGAVKRAIGTTSNPAVYGINLLLAFPFFFYYYRIARGAVRQGFWLAGTIVVTYNLMLTNTRAVLQFMAILLVLLGASGLVRLSRLNVALGLVGTVGILYLLPPSVWHRVLNPQAYDLHNATNLSWRFDLWAAAFRIGTENWLTGIGAGNLTYIIRYLDPTRFDGVWIAPHNEFLEMFMTMGAPGLAVFVAFLAIVLFQAVWLARAGAGHTIDPARRWFAVAAALTLFIGPAFALQVDAFHFPLKGWWLVAGLVLAAARLSRIEIAAKSPGAATMR